MLVLLSEGRTTKQIARAMGLSQSTIRSHAHTLYRKLGVPNAPAAVARAFGQAGFRPVKRQPKLTPPPPRLADEHPFLAAYLHHWERAGCPVPGLVDLGVDPERVDRDAMTAALAAQRVVVRAPRGE